MSIDQLDYPDWVNWVAQDRDGVWWGYSVEPLQHHQGWYENEVGEIIKLADDQPNPNWQDSLQRVNQS